MIGAEQIPFMPRGVRLHRCAVRKGTYLLAPERAVKMDPIGEAILGAMDGERSLAAIVDHLAAEFDAPRQRIEADVGKFLTDLVERRMVEVRG